MSTPLNYNHHLFWLIFKRSQKHLVFLGFLDQKPIFVDSCTKNDAVSRFQVPGLDFRARARFPASRARIALRGSPDDARCCQMLSDAPRCCQMLPEDPRCRRMLPAQMLSDAFRCPPGASRCCQMIPDVTDDPKCCQMLPAQMPQDARCWLMLPIPTPMPIPTPTQTPIQMPTPTTIPTPIPIQISTYNRIQYPCRFRVLPKGY